MKVSWNFGEMKFEFEGQNTKEIFKQIASAQVTFQDSKCGACGNEQLVYIDRVAESEGEKYEYLEIQCTKCRAKLSFGQGKDGSLYPKRAKTGKKGKVLKDGDKTVYLDNNGWTKFVPNAEDKDSD